MLWSACTELVYSNLFLAKRIYYTSCNITDFLLIQLNLFYFSYRGMSNA